jgi:hypothetical protein
MARALALPPSMSCRTDRVRRQSSSRHPEARSPHDRTTLADHKQKEMGSVSEDPCRSMSSASLLERHRRTWSVIVRTSNPAEALPQRTPCGDLRHGSCLPSNAQDAWPYRRPQPVCATRDVAGDGSRSARPRALPSRMHTSDQ